MAPLYFGLIWLILSFHQIHAGHVYLTRMPVILTCVWPSILQKSGVDGKGKIFIWWTISAPGSDRMSFIHIHRSSNCLPLAACVSVHAYGSVCLYTCIHVSMSRVCLRLVNEDVQNVRASSVPSEHGGGSVLPFMVLSCYQEFLREWGRSKAGLIKSP